MRHLTTFSLALAFALGSGGATVSQETEHPRIRYCNAGLERSINVCNNLHEVNSTNWRRCLDDSLNMHRLCVLEAVEHMDTVGG